MNIDSIQQQKKGICLQICFKYEFCFCSVNDPHNVEVKAILKSEILAGNKEEYTNSQIPRKILVLLATLVILSQWQLYVYENQMDFLRLSARKHQMSSTQLH